MDLDYFSTLGIGMTAGRDFSSYDRDGSVPVAIVNETMAARFWPNQNPIGKRFQFTGDTFFRQVVGVVKTANYQSLGELPQVCVYVPLRQNFAGWMVMYVRTTADPSTRT